MNEEEYTELIPNFCGSYIVYAECANCGMTVQYPTERFYVFCPYCGKRVRYKEFE